MNKPELLAPAGDPEKLKTAIEYGADAVYFGGEDYSLRSASDNFSDDDMRECVKYAHDRGKKCYLTLNIYAHNGDIEPMREYLRRIKDIPLDAFLVSDPGVLSILREEIPDAHVHLSTQANMTNYMAAEFWKKQGVERLVLARELSFDEIREIREKTDIELEAFIHGAMCISYSGRCLLSNFLSSRDANKGLPGGRGQPRDVFHELARPLHDRAYPGPREVRTFEPQDRRQDEDDVLCRGCRQGVQARDRRVFQRS